jgi:hypothetical protein
MLMIRGVNPSPGEGMAFERREEASRRILRFLAARRGFHVEVQVDPIKQLGSAWQHYRLV